MCGEQPHVNPAKLKAMGSPPRVRGTALRGVGIQIDVGITPACAGNSMSAAVATGSAEDHPRVCGEQYADLQGIFFVRGSPPRVRGTVAYCSNCHK